MSAASTIEWTDSTWNPTRGCSIVSPGCRSCYAMKQAHRFSGKGRAYEGLTKLTRGGPVWTGDVRTVPAALADPLHWVKGRRVFVDSMSDLFHPSVPFEYVDKVFAVMACTTRHTYQVLTKRPERMLEWFERLRWTLGDSQLKYDGRVYTGGLPDQVDPLKVWPDWIPQRAHRGGYDNCGPGWPLVNVWLGVSVEDQQRADERIPLLLKTSAAVRFLSCEPLLGPVDLRAFLGTKHHESQLAEFVSRGVDWTITGGESGPGARPVNAQWIRNIVGQCKSANVACFVKQLGRHPGFTLEDEERRGNFAPSFHHFDEASGLYIKRMGDSKGGDWTEWPADLRVRQFPNQLSKGKR